MRTFIFRALFALSAAAVATTTGSAQTTSFADNFNRTSLNTGAPTTYSTVVSAGDGGAGVATNFLQLTNNASAAVNTTGTVFVGGLTSSYTGGFDPVLANNAGQRVEWTYNFKSNTTLTGFGPNEDGLAFVVGATGPDLTTANGYAVMIGRGGTDRLELVSFANGINNQAVVITDGSAAGRLNPSTRYASVKLQFDQTTGAWSLFLRNDGTAAWGDPTTVTTQVGTAVVDSTFTATALDRFGFFFNYDGGTATTAQFDNYQVSLTPVPEPTLVFPVGLGAVGLAGWVRRRRRRPAA